MESQAESSMITRNLRAAKEQAGLELDFDTLLTWQYGTTVSQLGTPGCDNGIRQLRVMLHPFFDETYSDRMKTMQTQRKRLHAEHRDLDWDVQYQELILEAMTDLMKRRGLLPMGMV